MKRSTRSTSRGRSKRRGHINVDAAVVEPSRVGTSSSGAAEANSSVGDGRALTREDIPSIISEVVRQMRQLEPEDHPLPIPGTWIASYTV